jgi:hypothetical protein
MHACSVDRCALTLRCLRDDDSNVMRQFHECTVLIVLLLVRRLLMLLLLLLLVMQLLLMELLLM